VDRLEEVLELYSFKGYLFNRPRLSLVRAFEELGEFVEYIKTYSVFPDFCYNLNYQMILVPLVNLNLRKDDFRVRESFLEQINDDEFPRLCPYLHGCLP